jgi:hypothetical protein
MQVRQQENTNYGFSACSLNNTGNDIVRTCGCYCLATFRHAPREIYRNPYLALGNGAGTVTLDYSLPSHPPLIIGFPSVVAPFLQAVASSSHHHLGKYLYICSVRPTYNNPF